MGAPYVSKGVYKTYYKGYLKEWHYLASQTPDLGSRV